MGQGEIEESDHNRFRYTVFGNEATFSTHSKSFASSAWKLNIKFNESFVHPITALKEHLEEKMQEQGLFRGEVLTVQFVFLTVLTALFVLNTVK